MLNQIQPPNFKKFKLFSFLITIFVFLFFGLDYSFSYSPYNTHPALTEEMAKFYNEKVLGDATFLEGRVSINSEEVQWLRKGAIDEDEPPRWINHFYDPAHKVGWTGKHFGSLSEEEGYKAGADMAPKPAIASIDWAENQEYQSAYGSEYGNQTWQKALFFYTNGNKESAFVALGHILHLVEDLSVPDHTRNDSHAGIAGDPGSPYEDYTKEYTNYNKLTVAESLKNQNKEFYQFNNLKDYFEYLANYTNNNFFSEDTISNEEFEEPDLNGLEKEVKINGEKRILFFKKDDNYLTFWSDKTNKLSIDNNQFVLPSYREYLFPQAVLIGSSVINQFFKEAEFYKQNPELLEPITPNSYQSFSFNLKRAPKLVLLNTADFIDRNYINAKVFLVEVKSEVRDFVKNTSSTLKSFVKPLDAQQAGLPVLDINKGSKDEKAAEQQQSKISTIQSGSEEQETENQNRQNIAENSSKRNLSIPAYAGIDKLPKTSVSRPKVLGETVSRVKPNNLSLGSQSFTNKTAGYSPGFGGGEAAFSIAKSGNGQLTRNNNQTNSNDQNQNSGTSTDNAASTNQNNNQGNNASTTEDGSGSENPQNQNTASSTNATSAETQTADTTAPPPPLITAPENLNQTFTSQTIVFQGTAEANSVLKAEYFFNNSTTIATTTVSGTGIWSLFLSLNQGTTTIDFYAKDSAGNVSSSTDIKIFIDSLAPQIASFSVLECAASLATDGCLTATSTVNIVWSSDSSDLDYFELSYESEIFATTSTSTTLTLTEGEHTLSLSVRDKANNFSNQQTLSLEINLKPLVINEVAWAGTGSQTSNDEWLELFNRTNKTIGLNNFTLYAKDLAPYVNLQKRNSAQNALAPKSYYLLERTDDDAVKDISADQFFTGALDNQRENIYLVYVSENSTTTIDKTETCNVFGSWCGGSNDTYETMERYSPDGAYWGSNLTVIRNGKSSKGNPIFGTPKARNSLNYLIIPPNETAITKDTILTKDKSPYYIHYTITVPKGNTLTIEPGTVIKTRGGGEYYLNIIGELKAEGTENEEIVFTSFYDDEYGGDLNNDGAQIVPVPGSWTKVLFTENSSSTINYARFRYGGRYYGFCCQGMVKIDRATSTITNSVFEHSYTYGLELISSNSIVENNTFQNNNNYPQFQNPAGLSIGGVGAPQIINNTFQNNYYGIYISGVSEAKVEDNTFNSNTNKAIYVLGAGGIGSFKNNSGTLAGGVSDGIYVSDLRLLTNATTTLYSNSLPYIFHNNPTISARASLIVEPNVLIKNSSSNRIEVYGALETKGQSKEDIVFTSLSDQENDYWFGISANPGSRVSLSGTTIKHGGRIISWGAREKEAALYAFDADITVNNSLFYGNYKNGVMVVNSSSDIKNSEFKGHIKPDLDSRGLAYYNSTINLNNVEFRNNYLGLYADPMSLLGAIVSPLIFEGNASSSNVWLGW